MEITAHLVAAHRPPHPLLFTVQDRPVAVAMAGVAAASIAHLYLDSTLRDELNAQANAPSVEAGELALIAGAPSAESSSRLPDLSDALSTTAAFTRQAVEATRDGTLKAGAAVRPAMVATRQTTSALVEATRERTRKGLQTAKDATASGFQTAKDVMAPAAAAVEPAWDVMAPAIAPAASTVWNATKEGTRRSLDATRKGLDATRVAGGAVAGQLEPVLTATREADLSRLITATRDQTRRGLAKARSLSYDDLADFAEGATNNTRDALSATLATSLDVAVDIDNKLGEIVFDGADRAAPSRAGRGAAYSLRTSRCLTALPLTPWAAFHPFCRWAMVARRPPPPRAVQR